MHQIARPAPGADTIIVFNAGVNGNNTADLLSRIDKDVLQRAPQLVVLMVGTNDMLNQRNMLSLAAYEKNYRQLIAKLREKAALVVMTLPPVYSPYIILRKPEMKFSSNGPQERVDSANAVIRRLAAESKCTLIDLGKVLEGCGGSHPGRDALFQNEANSGTPDGVHPTAEGYRVIATAVHQTISILYPHVKKVVCFGDSITYGYKTEGEGTVTGQPYPAVLNKMLNAGHKR